VAQISRRVVAMSADMSGDRWKVVALSVALDLALGEPPERWHPVVWMGRLVKKLEGRAPREGRVLPLAYGAVVEAVCLAAVALPARLWERAADAIPAVALPLQAIALKPTFSVKALFAMVGEVERALERGDLAGARGAVGRIVSRDVEGLDGSGVAAAAVESLAENAGDSVVAPLLYYTVLGLPGAYGYRMTNTMDAMLGYRGRYEYLGKAAARLDDLLNLLPSRLAALAMVAASRLAGGSPARAWAIARRDSSRTASPNAGWPMAAAAGALDRRLEKIGHYVLNPEGVLPQVEDIRRARRLVGASLVLAVLGVLVVRVVLRRSA